MIKATTPTFVCTLPSDIDLSTAENVYFSISQKGLTITKSSGLEISGNVVEVFLSQSETIQLMAGIAQVQLNWTYAGGVRAASEIVNVAITDNLLKEVVE